MAKSHALLKPSAKKAILCRESAKKEHVRPVEKLEDTSSILSYDESMNPHGFNEVQELIDMTERYAVKTLEGEFVGARALRS